MILSYIYRILYDTTGTVDTKERSLLSRLQGLGSSELPTRDELGRGWGAVILKRSSLIIETWCCFFHFFMWCSMMMIV